MELTLSQTPAVYQVLSLDEFLCLMNERGERCCLSANNIYMTLCFKVTAISHACLITEGQADRFGFNL